MENQAMTKTDSFTHFELVSGRELPKFGDKIVQIYPKSLYENSAGYAVFLCEVKDD